MPIASDSENRPLILILDDDPTEPYQPPFRRNPSETGEM